jgi:hypothetical protein
MSAGKVKSIEKSQMAPEQSSPAHVFARQPSPSVSHTTFDAALVPQIAGNLAVQQLFRAGAIQAKLAISQPGDADEEEADRVADQVMRMAEPTPISSAPSTIRRKCAACEAGGGTCPKCEEEEKLQRKEKPGHAAQAAPAIHSQIAALRGGGQPLPPSVRAFFEPRFGADFSQVQVHTGSRAHESARAIQAKAFTLGYDVVFAAGKYAPDIPEGKRLLAHELTHTLQQRGTGRAVIQADFESDFAGRQEVPVEGTPVQPPGTVKVKTYQAEGGKWVYAPFGIYSPNQIPQAYQDRIMESGKAFQWRSPNPNDLSQGLQDELERLENQGELTVRDMRALAEGAGKEMNIRLTMVRVGSDYRFVGYDMSFTRGGVVTGGFVESEAGTTGGVGRALLADRVVRALANGAQGMHLEVYHSQRTADFHAQIFAVTGRPGAPHEGESYVLTTREMIRIALAWSEALTPQQRIELVTLASRETEPSAAEAMTAKTRIAEAEDVALAPGQLSPETLEAMRGLGREVSGSVRKAVELKDYTELSDPDTADRIIAENGGYAIVGGRMYRLQREGANVRAAELNPIAIRQTIAAGTSAAPAPAPAAKNRNALDPPALPSPTPPDTQTAQEVKEGDVLVVPYQTFIEARNAKTGEVYFGIFEGARWYRLETAKGEGLKFDPITGERLIPTQFKTPQGQPLYARSWDPEPSAPGQGGGSRLAKGAVGLGGAIQVINELLGPFGAALQAQRAWIARGKAEIAYWAALGADPISGVWDRQGEAPAPPGQKPDTAVIDHWYFPYVVDINAERLRANLPMRTASYQELQNLLSIGKSLGAIKGDQGKFTVLVNRWEAGKQHRYDITQAVTQTMTQVLQATDERLKAELAAMSATDRAGKIFRLNASANIYRSEQGQQIIRNSAEHIGPSPWVREISRRSSNALQYLWTGYRGMRVLVAPVNADAHRAAAFAQYVIYKPIDDVWEEVKKAGRAVNPASLPGEPLNSFSAAPGKGEVTEFGFTSYIRDPYNPGQWTIATGELKSFWVNAEDLTPMDEKEIDKFTQR